MLYKCVRPLEGCQQPVEIIDSAATSSDNVSEEHLQWAEAFIIVYSVCDKDSFNWATYVLQVKIKRVLFFQSYDICYMFISNIYIYTLLLLVFNITFLFFPADSNTKTAISKSFAHW